MKKIYLFGWSFLLLLTAFCLNPAQGQQLAFPGAEGFGRYTSGGRGGVVYEVTNLNDSGEGSFRAGAEMSAARTIVFRVSGTIHLESDVRIRNGDLTIAGQTAPGEGIAFKGGGIVVGGDNIIIRYIRVRPGDIAGRELDAMWGRQNKDIIIDHCSMSWSTDEVGSFYDNENFTMQWCILSESLYESVHGKGRHGYGGIWGGAGATFHHNLLAHHYSRNPRFNGARYTTTPETELVDFRNNVLYNWGGNSAYGGEEGKHNMVANYYKPGPATPSGEKSYRILDASPPSDGELGRWYIAGNYVEGYPEVTADNWNGGVQRLTPEQEAIARVYEPFPHAPVTTQAPQDAFASVLENAGASYPERDPLDERIVMEAATGTATYGGAYGAGKGIIDSQETVGGWPDLLSAPAPEDTDSDGMPDSWEVSMGLDPTDATDRNGDLDGDGYTNLEEYLNSLIETEPADFLPHPSSLVAEEVSMTSITLSWTENADRETAIILERAAEGEAFAEIASLAPNTTTYTDEGLASGQLYSYRLQAVSETETSAYSSPLHIITRDVPTAPNQNELAAYWNFNASSGTLVEDMSVYNNHGELVDAEGAEWIAGKQNNAIDFSGMGTSGHILVPHNESLAFGYSSFTVSFWMRAPAETDGAYLFHKGSFTKSIGAGTSGKWYGLELKDGAIRFAVDDNNTKSEVSADNSAFLSGEWVHVVAVRNSPQDVLRLYLNGDLVQEGSDLTSGTLAQEEPFIIANSGDLNAPFKGQLDEMKVFGYALNEAEVAGLYSGMLMQAFKPSPANAEANVNPDELVVSWSGDAPTYQLFVGSTSDNMELVAGDLTTSTYTFADLAASTTYFWRIDAVGDNETVSGEVWEFTTGVPTGLAGHEVLKQFSCYPNPFNEQFTVEFELQKREPVVVSVYDVQNRLVLELESVSLNQGVHRIKISDKEFWLKALPEGIYFCVVQTSEHKFVKRLMRLAR
jgi:hypothetical protein